MDLGAGSRGDCKKDYEEVWPELLFATLIAQSAFCGKRRRVK